MESEKPLVVVARSPIEANQFDKENGTDYRLSERLCQVENAFVFVRRAKK